MSGGLVLMVVTAASQAGTIGLVRVVVPLVRGESEARFWLAVVLALALMIPVATLAVGWWSGAGEVITFLFALAMWWRSRRKGRKRAASWLGAKSRALRDALVRKARQAAQRRPVAVPGGAR